MKEIFDRVKTHLLAQDERSRHSNGVCAYHAFDGLKCAVGCLITEDAYSEEFEGATVTSDKVKDALEASGINTGINTDNNTISMLTNLQSIHDYEAPDDWEHALDNLETKLFGDT